MSSEKDNFDIPDLTDDIDIYEDGDEDDLTEYTDDVEDDLTEDVDEDTTEEENEEEEEFDFSQFYQEDEESKEETSPEELGLQYNEESYDEILDLHSDKTTIAVEAEYPYIRVKGFLIKDEITFMRNTLDEYIDNIKNKYSAEDMLDIMLNIQGEDYRVGRVPLNLDTFLTIFLSLIHI